MDEFLEFKSIVARANGDGIGKEMILMPYAKDVSYNNGQLGFTLELFNNDVETNIGMKIGLSEDLVELLDNLLFGDDINYG